MAEGDDDWKLDVHPVLERDSDHEVSCGVWYALPANGTSPFLRVGQGCIYAESDHNIVVFGGANPDGAFDDVHVYNLGTH